jgi:hypothetical protein
MEVGVSSCVLSPSNQSLNTGNNEKGDNLELNGLNSFSPTNIYESMLLNQTMH